MKEIFKGAVRQKKSSLYKLKEKLVFTSIGNNKDVTFPQSTIYLTPGIVKEVSATFVATTHSRQSEGGSAKT